MIRRLRAIVACAITASALALALFSGLGSNAASAQTAVTPAQLLARDDLQARVTIDTEGELYERAPFQLAVEIATPRWFSRGTRVRDFRIPGAVVRPVSNFADNMSRRIDGQTWSLQRWRFRIFPRQAGALTIPPLTVFVSVNTETDGAVEGELTLDAPRPTILTPPGMQTSGDWVATPSLTVAERWEGLLESYVPGDAITRVRQFVLRDAPAMMLPANAMPSVDGLSIYNAPAIVSDETLRGSLLGTREETLIITFKEPGNYRLPGLEYDWFNTETRQVERLSLPPRDVVVSAAAGAGMADNSTSSRRFEWTANRFLVFAPVFVAGAALLWFVWSTAVVERLRKGISHRLHSWRNQRRDYRYYQQALREGDSTRCVALLYQQMNDTADAGTLRQTINQHALHYPGEKKMEQHAGLLTTLEQLLHHAYGKGTTLPGSDRAAYLWAAVGSRKRLSSPLRTNSDGPKLQLNPGPLQE